MTDPTGDDLLSTVIARRRHELGLSRPELAALSGLDRSTILNLETLNHTTCTYPPAAPQTIELLATALNLPLALLIECNVRTKESQLVGYYQPYYLPNKEIFHERAKKAGVTVVGTYVNNHTPVACICPQGHSCAPRPASVQQGGGWCAECVGRSPEAAERNFHLWAKADGVLVVGEYSGSNSPVACICAEGHDCFPSPASIQQGQGWCRICAGRDSITAENSFRLRCKNEQVTILGDYINSKTSVECKCFKGHKGFLRPNDIQQGISLCKTCAFELARKGRVKHGSGYYGVHWHERARNWRAMPYHKGNRPYLGSFLTEVEAARAVDTKLIELGLPPRNFPKER